MSESRIDTTPPIPNGWFAVAFSKELVDGEVKRVRYFGEELVLFRTRSGRAAVLDAYCPHLGAHLGVGAAVLFVPPFRDGFAVLHDHAPHQGVGMDAPPASPSELDGSLEQRAVGVVHIRLDGAWVGASMRRAAGGLQSVSLPAIDRNRDASSGS